MRCGGLLRQSREATTNYRCGWCCFWIFCLCWNETPFSLHFYCTLIAPEHTKTNLNAAVWVETESNQMETKPIIIVSCEARWFGFAEPKQREQRLWLCTLRFKRRLWFVNWSASESIEREREALEARRFSWFARSVIRSKMTLVLLATSLHGQFRSNLGLREHLPSENLELIAENCYYDRKLRP